jgi:hypothetical protein
MSEKLYSLLVRLYPPEFRRKYGKEAIQVFRDRLRDERGLLKRARLWVDVLLDLSVSVPREHRRAPSRPVQSAAGIPSFLVLEEKLPSAGTFLIGTVLALTAAGIFGFLLIHGGNNLLLPPMSNQPLPSSMTQAASPSNTPEQDSSSSEMDSTQVLFITAAERRLVIRQVIGAVKEYDRYITESARVAQLLEPDESSGGYQGIRDGSAFAALLTRQISGVTRHVTVTVMYGHQPAPGNELWIVPSRPGASIFRRIDNHFAVALAPTSGSRSLRQ